MIIVVNVQKITLFVRGAMVGMVLFSTKTELVVGNVDPVQKTVMIAKKIIKHAHCTVVLPTMDLYWMKMANLQDNAGLVQIIVIHVKIQIHFVLHAAVVMAK